MKTLLKIVLLLFVVNIYGQNERIFEMSQLSVYTDSAKFIVDDSTSVVNDYTMAIPWSIVSPKIKHEQLLNGDLSRSATFARITTDTTSNIERKVSLLQLNPYIVSQTPLVTASVNDYMTLYDLSETEDRRLSVSQFLQDIDETTQWRASVNLVIDLNITEVDDQILKVGADTIGYMSLRKTGDMVIGNICLIFDNGGTSVTVTNYTIPSALRPHNCGVATSSFLSLGNWGGSDSYDWGADFYYNGQIKIFYDYNFASTYKLAFAFSYLTSDVP